MTLGAVFKLERYDAIVRLGPVPSWWRVFARRRWIRQFRAVFVTSLSETDQIISSLYSREYLERMANVARPRKFGH